MSLHVWFAFLAASIVILLIPGPTVLLVIGDALANRSYRAWCTVLGVGLGDATSMAISLAGAGALLRTSAMAFTVMKTIGGLYLLYLGFKSILTARQSGGSESTQSTSRQQSESRRFLRAWTITVLNPKSILFFIAFVPQFISAQDSFLMQAGILWATFVLFGMINAAGYMILAGYVGEKLQSAAARRRIQYAGGGALMAAGTLTLALKHR